MTLGIKTFTHGVFLPAQNSDCVQPILQVVDGRIHAGYHGGNIITGIEAIRFPDGNIVFIHMSKDQIYYSPDKSVLGGGNRILKGNLVHAVVRS